MNYLETDVPAAARFLDEKIPDWFTKVNLGCLEMRKCYTCVLGQQPHGFYLNFKLLFGISWWQAYDDWQEENAAAIRLHANTVDMSREFLMLPFGSLASLDAWGKEILNRRV